MHTGRQETPDSQHNVDGEEKARGRRCRPQDGVTLRSSSQGDGGERANTRTGRKRELRDTARSARPTDPGQRAEAASSARVARTARRAHAQAGSRPRPSAPHNDPLKCVTDQNVRRGTETPEGHTGEALDGLERRDAFLDPTPNTTLSEEITVNGTSRQLKRSALERQYRKNCVQLHPSHRLGANICKRHT